MGSGAVPDDLPLEYGVVHMAAYLAWIVRKGWFDAEFVSEKEADPVRRRAPWAAVRLMDSMDGKLVDEFMTDEAVAFSDYYYEQFIVDWSAEFSDVPDYAVPDIPETHERAERLLDRRYAEWVHRGRPPTWRRSLFERSSRPLRRLFGWAILAATILAVGALGVLLDLRGFPWPLVQLAVVALILVWLAWRDLL